MDELGRMNLSDRAKELKDKPLFLHHGEFGDPMKLLLEVVTDELTDCQKCLFLNVEDLIIRENVRMLVQVESSSNLIDFSLIILELIILKLREVKLADDWTLVFQSR